MKPAILLLTIVSISLVACSQDIPASKVPSVIVNTVQAKYPGAASIEWEKKKNVYEAEFSKDSVEHTLQIDTEGKIIRHEYEIAISTLPASVTAAIQSLHAEYVIDEASVIEQQGQLFYEVELEAKGKKDKKIVFTPDGKTISNS